MTPVPSEYLALIERIHQELDIPRDYAAQRRLLPHPEALKSDLVEIARTPGKTISLIRPAAAAWLRLSRAAAESDIELVPLSGFRSVVRQEEIIREKVAAGRSLTDILRAVAAPGYSEHHSGRALDIGSSGEPPLQEAFADTAAYLWLQSHAAGYGFRLSFPRDNPHGIQFEPWH